MNTLKGAMRSKTVWFNLVMLVLLGSELVNSQYPLDPKVLALIAGFGNLALRFITTGSLADKN